MVSPVSQTQEKEYRQRIDMEKTEEKQIKERINKVQET